MEDPKPMEQLSSQVRVALGLADLDAFSALLDPNVHWGPAGDPSPPCTNRRQVLAWYEGAKSAGASAIVSAILVLGDRLLVALRVRGARGATRRGEALRWQLLSVTGGLIVEIVGFDSREDALAFANSGK